MEHFRINQPGYTMPEPEPKWTYNIGTRVVFVSYEDEPISLQVRFA